MLDEYKAKAERELPPLRETAMILQRKIDRYDDAIQLGPDVPTPCEKA
jgi:hypothetical protein